MKHSQTHRCIATYARLQYTAIIALLLTISGCGLFELDTESSVLRGRWESNVVPTAGICCGLDLTLENDEENITGRGIIKTPGTRQGDEFQFSIEVTGTYRDNRLELRSTSQANPVFIQGTLMETTQSGNGIILEVDFDGFGHTGEDIVLFQR